MNDSRLDLYFFTICGIGVINFFAFTFLAMNFQLNEYDEEGNYVQPKAPSSIPNPAIAPKPINISTCMPRLPKNSRANFIGATNARPPRR